MSIVGMGVVIERRGWRVCRGWVSLYVASMHSWYVGGRSPQGLGMWRSGVTTGAFSLGKSSRSGNLGLRSNAECFRTRYLLAAMVSARM